MLAGKPVPARRALYLLAERVPGPGAGFCLWARGCWAAWLCVPGAGWLRAAGGKLTFRGGDPPWPPACPAVRTGRPVRWGADRAGVGGGRDPASSKQLGPQRGPCWGKDMSPFTMAWYSRRLGAWAGCAGGALGLQNPVQGGSVSCKDRVPLHF